jgi:hypothetical protein
VIERRLAELAEGWFPATPPVADRTRLPAAPDARPIRPLVLALALVALGLTGAAVAATALDLVPGVRVEHVEQPPSVGFTQFPGYGVPVTLAAAQEAVPFALLLPRGLGRPGRILLDRDRAGSPVVTAVYGGERRARLVLTQWVARAVLFDKLLRYDTRVQPVDVDGSPGLWIEGGRFHDVFYLGRSGSEERAPGFLAGNVLVWQRGAVSYRLEAAVGLPRALELAALLQGSP